MIKFRLYFDKDKESAWLNDMAQQGYELEKFFMGVYRFKKGEPGRYHYQIDFARGFCSVSKDYREFMEEQGVEIMGCWGPWVFLRKKSVKGDFQLYSDYESKIAHYSKICTMFKTVAILEILILIMETILMRDNFQVEGVIAIAALALMAFVFCHMALRMKQMIYCLKEESGQGSGKRCHGSTRPSPLLAAGLLLNAMVLCISEQISQPLHCIFQIIAIVFMVIGLWRTDWRGAER